jgi:hypothetical protein
VPGVEPAVVGVAQARERSYIDHEESHLGRVFLPEYM